VAFFQDKDLITITDGAQTVGHKDTSTALILKDAVDVLEEGLLRVGVEGGCLDIDQPSGPLI
jgi:hypothetical protein